MSEEMPLTLTLAEKIVGLVLIIIGAVIAYNALNPPSGISLFSGIFVVIGAVVVITGFFLLLIKGE